MDVGFELRQARERRGLSLQQLSNTTKISPRVLQAIEASDESRLPAAVFARSFVKTYAAEVRLDPDETMRRYFEQFAPPAAPATAEPVRETTPVALAEHPADWWTHAIPERFVTRGLLALLCAAGILVFLLTRQPTVSTARATLQEPPAVATAAAPPTESPAPSTSVGTSGSASESADVVRLTIAPIGPCWVGATVAGKPVLAALLKAGDQRTLDVTSEVRLRLGSPAACAFTINGVPARVPGPRGEPATVRITRENYRQFAAAPR